MKIIKSIEEISNELTIVDFFANWCGPCKMLGPVLEELAEEGIVDVVKVDCDESLDLAREYKVSSIPALFLMKDKKVIDSKVGYMDLEELQEWVKEHK